MMNPQFLRYIASGLAITFSSFGTGLGQGVASLGIMSSFGRQELGDEQKFRAMVIGFALSETGGILTLMLVVILLLSSSVLTLGEGIAELGIGIGMGISAGVVSFASSMAVRAACFAIARQPFFAHKITVFMVLLQSIAEAPIIFIFIVSLIIKLKAATVYSTYHGLFLLCASLVVSIGCIGPSFGQAQLIGASCSAIGMCKSAYSKIFAFSLICQAIIETPVIFSLVISFLLIYRQDLDHVSFNSVIAAISSVIAMGVGSFGPGISIGHIASRACTQITLTPERYSHIFRMALISIGFVESSVIYSLIIALFVLMQI
jgi:F0F1-type ATP synthase membrane subunit c/vacuolar-type H+-ATPase subunit K